MKRRTVLISVAVLLTVFDAVALAHFTPPPAAEAARADKGGRLEFLIDTQPEADEMVSGDPGPLPQFDRAMGGFSFDGAPVADFAPFVRGLELGPHGSDPFVVVSLPDDATMQDYAAALVPLVEQGICRIGVYVPVPAEELMPDRLFRGAESYWPGKGVAGVLQVREIRPQPGVVRNCEDRFPPWNGNGRYGR